MILNVIDTYSSLIIVISSVIFVKMYNMYDIIYTCMLSQALNCALKIDAKITRGEFQKLVISPSSKTSNI